MLSPEGNVLHLIDTLWLGGAQRALKGLFENNREQKKLFLLALRETGQMTKIHHDQVYAVSGASKWNFNKPLQTALKLIKKHNIKSLHCHLPKSQLTGYIIKQFYYPEIRLLFQEHGDIMDRIPFNLPVYALGRKKIDAAICCSEVTRRTLIEKTGFLEHKTQVVYNYSNNNAPVNFDTIPLHQNGKATFHVGFAGRIIKRKGWRDFLMALHLLLKEKPDTKLQIHIAGAGPESGQLKKLISTYAFEPNVKIHGFVQNMRDFYSELDLLCVPSHWEPLGMVHLEAMSHGIPVIASDVPGINELVKHEKNALLFQPEHPEQIKNSILRVMNSSRLYNQLRNNGRETVKIYNYQYFEDRINEVYAEQGI